MRKARVMVTLVTALAIAGFAVVLNSKTSQAQEAGHGVILRALIVTPNTNRSPEFEPGPAISESSLANEGDFISVLKQLNPEWSLKLLAKVSTGSAAAIETGELSGYAEVVSARDEADGKVAATLRLQAIATHPAVEGFGFGSTNFNAELPAGKAHLIAGMKDPDNPSQVLVFATLTKGTPAVPASGSKPQSAQMRRKLLHPRATGRDPR